MYVDVSSTVALRQRISDETEKLCKMKLIKRSPKLTLLVAYYKVSNVFVDESFVNSIYVCVESHFVLFVNYVGPAEFLRECSGACLWMFRALFLFQNGVLFWVCCFFLCGC